MLRPDDQKREAPRGRGGPGALGNLLGGRYAHDGTPPGAAVKIIRSKHESDFLILPNATVRDQRLSYLARGILVEILSRPDGWETTADRIMEQARLHRGEKHGEGRRAIRAAFVELEAAGYMHRVKIRGARGRYTTTVYVTDVPTQYTGPRAA